MFIPMHLINAVNHGIEEVLRVIKRSIGAVCAVDCTGTDSLEYSGSLIIEHNYSIKVRILESPVTVVFSHYQLPWSIVIPVSMISRILLVAVMSVTLTSSLITVPIRTKWVT